jgi:hypothetical protein
VLNGDVVVTCGRSLALGGGGVPQVALYCLTTLGYKSVSIYPSWLQHGRLIRAVLIRLDYLDFHAKLSSLLRTHLSGTDETLVGRDPGVPMSLKR